MTTEAEKRSAKGYVLAKLGPNEAIEEAWRRSEAVAHVHADKRAKHLKPGGYVSVYERADDGVWVLKRTDVFKEPKPKRSRANLRLVKGT